MIIVPSLRPSCLGCFLGTFSVLLVGTRTPTGETSLTGSARSATRLQMITLTTGKSRLGLNVEGSFGTLTSGLTELGSF